MVTQTKWEKVVLVVQIKNKNISAYIYLSRNVGGVKINMIIEHYLSEDESERIKNINNLLKDYIQVQEESKE